MVEVMEQQMVSICIGLLGSKNKLNIKIMKTILKTVITGLLLFLTVGILVSCSSSKEVYSKITKVEDEFKIEKSGAQLWGEACNRCHLAPSPADYNDTDWRTISLHMRVRANLTEKDITKIETFLKSAN